MRSKAILVSALLASLPSLAVTGYAPWTCGKAFYCTQATGQGSHIGANWHAYDFGLPLGEPVLAIRAGTVHAVKSDGVGGCCAASCNGRMNYVVIDHQDGTYAHYYHLDTGSSGLVHGQWIEQGQPIGRAGYTGYTCGNGSSLGDGSWSDASASHLHIVVRDASGNSLPLQFADIGWPQNWGLYTSGNCVSAPPPSPCDGLGYAGACDGAVLRWCENGQLKTYDCGAAGKICGWENDEVGNNCLADPCAGLGYAGACDGTTLRWCENGQLKSYDCAWAGMSCGWQNDSIGNNCVPRPPPDTCASLGYAGRCDGSTLKWCEGGVVRSYNCAWAGMGCGWQNESIGYNCLGSALSTVSITPAAKPPPELPKARVAHGSEEELRTEMESGCSTGGGLQLGALLALLALARPVRTRRALRRGSR